MPFVRKARPLSDPNLRKPNAGLTKYEKVIYDIYSKALNDVRNQLGDKKVLDDIIDALKANSAAKVPNALNWRTFIISLDKTVPTLSKQIAAMANLHAKNLPRKIRYEYEFEAKDPRAIAWAQTQAGKRIQGITLETQQAVANLISDGLRTKLSREEIIAQLRQTVGLDKRQSRALGTFYERRLNKYLEDGMTYEEAAAKAEKEGNKYRVRLVKQRAIRIARTEISAATNAGRYLSWVEADARDLLPIGSTKRWITARDERTCDVCGPMNGLEISWTMNFSTGDQMPPAHPNCRCTAVIVPAEESFAKHLQGRHNQKTHGGGMGPNWQKGEWHQMNDKEYVSFISDSNRLATGKSEKRVITKTEWNRDYALNAEGYLIDKPTRVYKNGKIVVFSNQSASPYHTEINEASFMRDVDDLQEKYPLDQLVIRIGDDITNVTKDTAFGATVRGGQGGRLMWIKGDALNPNQMRQGGYAMDAQFKTGVRTYVLTHEWGHAIDSPDIPLDFTSKDKLINDTLSRTYQSLGLDVAGTKLMSTYGNSDPSEAFAEGFLDYVVGQDRGKPSVNPLVMAMAQTFGWDKPWKK